MSASDAQPQPAPQVQSPQLTVLLELQEQDLALDRLAYRRRELAERAAVSEMAASLAESIARVAEARDQRDKLVAQQQTFDEHSEAVGARIAHIEQRLRSGTRARTATSRQWEKRRRRWPAAARDRGPGARGDGGPRASRPRARRFEDAAAVSEELALAREQLGLAEAAIDRKLLMSVSRVISWQRG